MNKAYNTKLAWDICAQPQKQWVKIVKDRYIGNGNIFQHDLVVGNTSWHWKAVLNGIEYFRKGACCNLGNARDIKIWKEPWIPDIQGFKLPVQVRNKHSPLWVTNLFDDQTK